MILMIIDVPHLDAMMMTTIHITDEDIIKLIRPRTLLLMITMVLCITDTIADLRDVARPPRDEGHSQKRWMSTKDGLYSVPSLLLE